MSARARRIYLRRRFTPEELHAKVTRWAELATRLVDGLGTPEEAREWVRLDTIVSPFQSGWGPKQVVYRVVMSLVYRPRFRRYARKP
jgi:hypothetical protein